jgi:hypothetical protein
MNVFAYDYPILGLFWTILWVFLWVAWLMLLFRVIIDIFRSRDLSGVAKALWAILVIVLPYLGVFLYLIARGRSMTERDIEDANANEQAFRAYVQEAAAGRGGSGGTADELAKLGDLKERGVISDSEFQQQKAKLLS